MYSRSPLNRMIKVRSVIGPTKFCRYSHTNYSRRFIIVKCDELRTTKSPLILSTLSRSFSVGRSNENEHKTQKYQSNLMAPNLRSNRSSLKFTSKNRKEIGENDQSMPQKSLALKKCRHSTKKTSGISDMCAGKTETNEKIDRTETKPDFCHYVCGLSSSNLKSPLNNKVPGRIIDGRTDPERKKLCRTLSTCRECVGSPPAKKNSMKNKENFEDVNIKSSVIDSTNNLEKPPTTTQSTAKLQDSSDGTIDGSTNNDTTIISTKFGKISRNRRARLSNGQWLMANGSRTYPIDLRGTHMRPSDNFIRSSANTKYPMQSMPIRSMNSPKSQYARMIRFKQTRRLLTQGILLKYRLHPHLTHRIDPRQICPANQIDNRQTYIGRFPAPYDVENQQFGATLPPLQPFQTQLKPNTNPCGRFVKQSCHLEQLKPAPFRYLPIYPKNYYSDPVIETRPPRFDLTYVPYQSINLSQKYEWQNSNMNSPELGSGSGKNRQMLNSQSKMPKMITNPTKFGAEPVSINNVATDSTKGITLPLSDVNKKEPKDSATCAAKILQRSMRIMSKLVENLTVFVDGPRKLKLATSPYPKLRDEKEYGNEAFNPLRLSPTSTINDDVIIQMEYVNLTDADARHYFSGKYNPYSYATTTAGRTGSGIIIETGQNVHDLMPGDKVFVKPISCGKCSLCLSDQRNLCECVTASELSPMAGVLTRLHSHSSEFVTKIPDNVSIFNGAMTWTLSTAIRACQKASVSAGDVVLVIGGGALGMATSLAAQLLGATTVCLADIRKPNLDDAKNLSTEEVFRIDPRSPPKNTAIKLAEQNGIYPRVTFDCTGSQLTNEIAINATQTGGKMVVMTNCGDDIPLRISNLVARGIDAIVCTCGNDESDNAALRFLSTKKILFENSLDKHYDLSNANEAFEDLHNPNRLNSHIIVKCGCTCGSAGVKKST